MCTSQIYFFDRFENVYCIEKVTYTLKFKMRMLKARYKNDNQMVRARRMSCLRTPQIPRTISQKLERIYLLESLEWLFVTHTPYFCMGRYLLYHQAVWV